MLRKLKEYYNRFRGLDRISALKNDHDALLGEVRRWKDAASRSLADMVTAEKDRQRAEDELRSHSRQNDAKIERLEKALAATEKRYAEVMTRLDRYQTDSQARSREMFDMEFMSIGDCKWPILWIRAPKFMLDQGTFANLHDRMKRVCPHIKLLFVTSNEATLTELDDVELNKMGLARIVPQGVLDQWPDGKSLKAGK